MVFTRADTGAAATPWVLYAPGDLPGTVERDVGEAVARWFACWRPGELPTLKQLAPEGWPALMSSSYLLDSLGGNEFRFRLAGWRFNALHNQDATGRKLSEVMRSDSRTRGLLNDLAACTGSGWPIFRTGWTVWLSPLPSVRFQRVMLPLSAGGEGSAARVFGAVRFYPRRIQV